MLAVTGIYKWFTNTFKMTYTAVVWQCIQARMVHNHVHLEELCENEQTQVQARNIGGGNVFDVIGRFFC